MTTAATTWPTLSERLLPAPSARLRWLEAAAFSALTALLARLEVRLPWTPVPITGQTLGVLCAGALLGSRGGAAAMLLYLGEGALGLPVFSGGAAGFWQLSGPTGGYLLGFVPAAWLVGRLAERGWDRSPLTAASMMLLGSAAIFGAGLLGLSRFVPARALLAAGLYPFLVGDLAKVCLSAAALPAGWRLLGRGGPAEGAADPRSR